MYKIILLTLPLLMFLSACDSAERDYNKLMSSDNIYMTDYREYLEKHPDSPYASIVRDSAANRLIDTYSIQDIINRDYYFGNDDDVYYSIMRLLNTEDYVRDLALRKDQIEYYELYLEKFPQGRHYHQIELLLIDKEVDETFSGEHGKLPPLDKGTRTGKSYSTISLENKTQYELIVSYKGPDKKRIVIVPYGKTNINIGNGYYKVAARVKDADVLPYAGEENLDGSNYNSSYYIEYRGSRFNPSISFNPNFTL